MGRATYGVIGVRLSTEKGDRVVAMAPVSLKFPTLLSLTTTGYGKRSPTDEYRRTKRGAKGVRTIKTGGRNGAVVAVLPTTDTSEVLVTTEHGITIRIAVKGIRSQARNTLGVRVIRLDEGDSVRDAVILEPTIEPPGAETPEGTPAAPHATAEESEEEDDEEDTPEARPTDAPPDDDSDDEEGDEDASPSETR
jgi:DNA gyrase subunit A